LANIKSAIKKIRQDEKRTARNRMVRSRMRTFVKKANQEMAEGEATSAEAVRQAISEVDSAAQKGIIHRNKANRTKSRLMKRLNALEKQA
jgi:small subunit ribosomal protein S20